MHDRKPDKVPQVLMRRGWRIALYGAPVFLVMVAVIVVIEWNSGVQSKWAFLLLMLLNTFAWGASCLRMRDWRRFVQTVREAEYRVCPTCGYPLKGLADAGNCPECGEVYELDALRQQWESAVKPMFEWPRNKSK